MTSPLGKDRKLDGPKRAQVELFLAARALPNRDVTSKTDPYVEVYVKTVGLGKDDRPLGRTEIIKDNLDPRWSKSFIVEYFFERVQVLTFKIWDYDGKKKKEDFVGKASCELGEIMGAPGQALAVELDLVETKVAKKPADPREQLSKTGSMAQKSLAKLMGKRAEILLYADEVKVEAETPTIRGYSQELLSSMPLEELEKILADCPAEVKKSDKSLRLEWSGEGLDKMDLGGSSDPYMKIAIQRRGGSGSGHQDGKSLGETGFEVEVYKGEVVKKNLNPKWPAFEIPLEKLCNNLLDTHLQIQCWDWDRIGKDDMIGAFSITAKALTEATPGQTFELINETKKSQKKDYTHSGKIIINSATLLNKETMIPNKDVTALQELINKKKSPVSLNEGAHEDFVRYLAGGCELNIIFGIDFTGSNRKYDSPGSLHSLLPHTLNPYQQVIKMVGHIVQFYSHDKKFPAYGYAAGVKDINGGKTLDCFNLKGFDELDGKAGDPLEFSRHCDGIEDVLHSYEKAVPKLNFGDMGQVLKPDGKAYKGDDFYQLIDVALKQMGEISQEKQKYTLLLLVIDGDYVDMKATVDAIIRAGKQPLSVVIIGIGNNDFLNCIKMDADDEALISSSGEKACRDVVQFVKYNDYRENIEALGAKVLEELPTQFVEFMRMKGYNPNARQRQDL